MTILGGEEVESEELDLAAPETRAAGRFNSAGVPAERSKDFGAAVSRLGRMLGPMWIQLAVVVVVAVTSAVLNVFGPRVLGHATNIIVQGFYLHQGNIDFTALHRVLFQAAALYASSAFLAWLSAFMLAGIVQRLMLKLRALAEDKIHALPLAYIDKQARGDLLSRVTNDLDNVAQSLQQTLSQMLTSVLMMVGVAIMMFWISPILAAVALTTVPVSVYGMRAIAKRSRPRFITQWQRTGLLNAQIEETFTGHSIVKAFGRQHEVEERFRATNEELYEASFGAQFMSSIMQPLTMFMGNIQYVIVAVVGGLRFSAGAISIGDIQSFIQYSRNFSMPLTQLASMMNVFQSGIASFERVVEFLDAPEQSPDPAATPDVELSDAEWDAPLTSEARPEEALLVDIDGFEGPLDLLVHAHGAHAEHAQRQVVVHHRGRPQALHQLAAHARVESARVTARTAGQALMPVLNASATFQVLGLGYDELGQTFSNFGAFTAVQFLATLTYQTPLDDTQVHMEQERAQIAIEIAEQNAAAARAQAAADAETAVRADAVGRISRGLLGNTQVCDFSDFVLPAEHCTGALNALFAHLDTLTWSTLVLHSLPCNSPTLAYLKALDGRYSVDIEQEDVAPALDLPADWEAYLATLSKKDRHELRRKFRRLEGAGDVQFVTCTDHAKLQHDISDFLTLHRESRDDKAAFMNDHMEAFFREMVQEFCAADIARLSFVEVNGHRCAAILAFDYGTDETPFALKLDMARQCWDESRHVEISVKLGEHMGTEIGEYTEATFLYEAACVPDPAMRLSGVNRALAGLAIDVFNTHLSLPTTFSRSFWTRPDRMGWGPNQLEEAKNLVRFVEAACGLA